MTNYVKFLRGTPSAFATLETKDKNTLYFISAVGATVGKLYLGDILVAGNVTPEGDSIVDSLGELIDVNLAGLKTGQVLSYNGAEWVPMTLPEAVSASVMIGATATTAGSAGLVPAPQAGDQNKFLRGDGTWVEVATNNVNLDEYAKKTDVVTIINESAAELEIYDRIVELEKDNDEFEDSMSWGTL
jgi:hypothetical protein